MGENEKYETNRRAISGRGGNIDVVDSSIFSMCDVDKNVEYNPKDTLVLLITHSGLSFGTKCCT